MNDLTPADCFAITIAAGVGLFGGYLAVMWLADRAIASIGHLTRWEE